MIKEGVLICLLHLRSLAAYLLILFYTCFLTQEEEKIHLIIKQVRFFRYLVCKIKLPYKVVKLVALEGCPRTHRLINGK